MDEDIQLIISRNDDKIPFALNDFQEKAVQVFSFPELSKDNLREDLWKALFEIAQKTNSDDVRAGCFATVRILSRDKTNLNELASEGWLNLLKKYAGLEDQNEQYTEKSSIEALKCLCNMVYNSPVALTICTKNGTVDGIMHRIKMYKKPKLQEDIKFFDMKLLFLITALYPEIRYKIRDEYHGMTYLTDTINLIVNEAVGEAGHNLDNEKGFLTDKQADILCEILKSLFNITLRQSGDEDEESHNMDLVVALRKLLVTPTKNSEKKFEVISHTVNLLTNIPNKCYKPLIIPVQPDENIPDDLQYEGQNMTALNEILSLLERKFCDEPDVRSQNELLSPVLSLLLKCVSSDRIMRKYLRQKILPPLRDVHNRPEEGKTTRNSLCRLLTSPITQVKDLAAELLFVLCKHSVNRMIKYTGYGNAAGLFAKHGLLGGRNSEDAAAYSSDSEDSDTEEYQEHKHGINPVIGCYEPPRPNPTANMTEEQKEYEAMKLVELMDNMTRTGVVKPCRIGEDGKPEPIEHVLQLQEGLRQQQIRRDDSEEDD